MLDILTETYDQDIYNGPKTISEIMDRLLTFSGIGTDQCELNDFADYEINIPLPESPVREIIQRLAFSCGATLTVNDDNKIIFSQKNIDVNNMTENQKALIPKFMFNQPVPFNSAGVLLEEPRAEALSYTTKIAMYTYNSVVDEEVSELGSSDVSTVNPTKITFSAAAGGVSIESQTAQQPIVIDAYSQHATIQLSLVESETLPVKVTVQGRKVTTTKTLPRTVDMDTLLLDSGIASVTPENLLREQCNDEILLKKTFFYDDWYGAKFKYICKTRNEYLVKAGDIIYFETPFSDEKPSRVGYVLRNSYSDSNNSDSGEMEVIMIANS